MSKKQNNPVIMVSGDKGGVGKSTVCTALVEWMVAGNYPVRLAETDTSNPDVYQVLKDKVPTEQLNLDNKDGWMNLINVAAEKPETLVVNMAARIRTATEQNGELFAEAMKELSRPLVMVWVINRGRDSIQLLKKSLSVFPNLAGKVVAKNLYFSGGQPEKFTLWDESDAKKNFEADGGVTIDFPELHDRITDVVSFKRVPFTVAVESDLLQFGERMVLRRWLSDTSEVFEGIKKQLCI